LNCLIHNDAPGIGICVSCRRVVCDACSTRLQGRNFCSECLADRASQGAEQLASRSSVPTRIGLGLLAITSAGVLALAVFSAGFLLYLVG
jgi:hypothetical protein